MADVPARVFGSEASTFRAGPAGSNVRDLHVLPADATNIATVIAHGGATGTWMLSPLATVSTQTPVPAAPSAAANKGWRDNGYMHPAQAERQTRITGSWVFRYSLREAVGLLNVSIDFTVICYAVDPANATRELWRSTASAILITPVEANTTQTVNPGTVILNAGEILQYEFYQTVAVNPNPNTQTVFRVEAAAGVLAVAQIDVPEITAYGPAVVDGGGDLSQAASAARAGAVTVDGGGTPDSTIGHAAKTGVAVLAGGGTPDLTVGHPAKFGAVAVDGGGTPDATVGVIAKSSAVVAAGGGEATATGIRATQGRLSSTGGGGDLVGAGGRGVASGAVIGGGGELVGQGAEDANEPAALDGGGELGLLGGRAGSGMSAVAGGGELVLAAGRAGSGLFTVAGGGTVDVVSGKTSESPGAVSGGGDLEGSAARAGTAPFALAGGGFLELVGIRSGQDTGAVGGGGDLIFQGRADFPNSVHLDGGGDLQTVGPKTAGCPATSQDRIPPTVIVATTNLAGELADITDNPDTDDGLWLTAPLPILPTYAETSFAVPLENPTGDQQMRVRVRPTFLLPDVIVVTEGLLPPTVTLEVADVGGAVIATRTLAVPGTWPSGGVVTLDWNASSLIDPSGASVHLRVHGTPFVLGTVGWTVEIGGEAWLVDGGCSASRVNGGGELAVAGAKGACQPNLLSLYSDVYDDVYRLTEGPTACPTADLDGGGTFVAAGVKHLQPLTSADLNGGGELTGDGTRTSTTPIGDSTFGALSGGGSIAAGPGFSVRSRSFTHAGGGELVAAAATSTRVAANARLGGGGELVFRKHERTRLECAPEPAATGRLSPASALDGGRLADPAEPSGRCGPQVP